jgi:hypothetical protein
VGEVGLGRDVGEKMRHVGKGWGLGAKTAIQLNRGLILHCLRHDGDL